MSNRHCKTRSAPMTTAMCARRPACCLTGVPPRTRDALRLRFEEDLNQAETGALLGVSQMQISRILRQRSSSYATSQTQHDRMHNERAESEYALT
jgi:DNA-directed RNA polymerase specialized sigma24 family protein